MQSSLTNKKNKNNICNQGTKTNDSVVETRSRWHKLNTVVIHIVFFKRETIRKRYISITVPCISIFQIQVTCQTLINQFDLLLWNCTYSESAWRPDSVPVNEFSRYITSCKVDDGIHKPSIVYSYCMHVLSTSVIWPLLVMYLSRS